MPTPIQPTAPLPAAAPAGSTYTDVNGLAELKKDPSSPQAIKAVAQQVDALFLQMMLKSMRDAGAEEGEPESNEMGMYQDMFDKQIALQLSQHQSLGIGAQLTRQLAAQAAAAKAQGAAAATPAASPSSLVRGGLAPSGSAAGVGTPAAATPGGTASSGSAAGGSAAGGTGSGAVTPAAAAGSGAAKAPATSSAVATSPSHFVSLVYPAIQRAAAALGVNPLGMLAQAALETGWGQRMARTAAGTPSLNMFGIKADDGWGGERAGAETLEFSGGVATQRHTAFRAYASIESSVHDFAKLLGSSPRYRDAVASGGDARAYVAAIGKSGYATDPNYATKLNDILHSTTFYRALKAGTTRL
jgi:flagellar protein FlgJ